MQKEQIKKILNILWPAEEADSELNVYAILDAGRDEKIFIGLHESSEEFVCLYKGKKAEELETVAPYLVRLEKDRPFTEWLIKEGWGNSWGIFCRCDLPMEKVRDHFRNLLMVLDEEGTPFYFRFYDPRVFRIYLPTCNKEELEIIFGPIKQYYIEEEHGISMMTFIFFQGKLLHEVTVFS